MEYKTLHHGGQIPVLGLGTWKMGGAMAPDYSQDTRVIKALQTALELGYTHIDTAEMYAGGHTEKLIGRAIQGLDRERLFITTKVWQTNLRYQDVIRAPDRSLKRLGLDYVDLYLIHWPNERIPLSETVKALNELVKRKQVRHIGVSNFNREQLSRVQRLSEAPIATNQVPYSITNRTYTENQVLSYCQENGILLTAYTPIEHGAVRRNATLRQIAERQHATPVQVALSWLIQQPNVIAIPMSMNPNHLRENLAAVDLKLSEEEITALDRLA